MSDQEKRDIGVTPEEPQEDLPNHLNPVVIGTCLFNLEKALLAERDEAGRLFEEAEEGSEQWHRARHTLAGLYRLNTQLSEVATFFLSRHEGQLFGQATLEPPYQTDPDYPFIAFSQISTQTYSLIQRIMSEGHCKDLSSAIEAVLSKFPQTDSFAPSEGNPHSANLASFNYHMSIQYPENASTGCQWILSVHEDDQDRIPFQLTQRRIGPDHLVVFEGPVRTTAIESLEDFRKFMFENFITAVKVQDSVLFKASEMPEEFRT